MAIRVPWTKHEVALLIDACMEFETSHRLRNEIVKDVSKKLRKLAIKNGLEIDEIYRNENGISMQFTIMQATLHDTESGLHGASKLFTEMKDLYFHNKPEYERILKEAQAMLEGNKKHQDKFVEWLSTQVSPAQLSELYFAYEEIDKFCIQRGILKKALLETTDIKTVNQALQVIEQNKVFRFTHKREINKIISAARYYYKYVKTQRDINIENPGEQATEPIDGMDSKKEKPYVADDANPTTNTKNDNSITRTNQDVYLLEKYPIVYKKVMESLPHSLDFVGENGVTPKSIYENIRRIARPDTIEYILDNASWAKKTGTRYVFSQEVICKNDITEKHIFSNDEDSKKTSDYGEVDFNNITNLAFTKPTYLSYFGEEIVELKSWTDLYLKVINFLYEDYPDKLPVCVYFHGARRIDFGDFQTSKSMVAPKQIADNLFVETNLSATNIVMKIKALLDHCLIDYENVVICYENKNNYVIDDTERDALNLVNEEDEFDAEDDLEEAYYRYAKAAEAGNADGMYHLGVYYLKGWFVNQNDERALYWLKKAAEKGQSNAANEIGIYYHNLRNYRGKYFEAIKWYKLGAELENKYSLCNLGWYYEYGLGCNVDLLLSKKYYELSANQDYDYAKKCLTRINKKINNIEKPDSLTQFSAWLRETVKMSPATIQGYISAVKVISEKAVEWELVPSLLYCIDDTEDIKKYINTVFIDETFKKLNEEQHNRFTAALKKYMEFRTGSDFTYSKRGVRTTKENEFYNWLLNEKNLAAATCRTHLSGINEVLKYVNANNLLEISIFEADNNTIATLFDQLLKDEKFIKLNEGIYNRGKTAIYKYLEFLGLPVPDESVTFRDYIEKESAFFKWLLTEKELAPSTCRTHKIGINDVNRYVVNNGLINTSIFEADTNTVNNLFNKLLSDKDFLIFNDKIYNRGRLAVYKYMEFIAGSNVTLESSTVDLTPYEIILEDAFPKGFRLDSAIEIKKFKRQWASLNGEEFELDDDKIGQYIKRCGVVYDGRVYATSSMISEELKTKLFTYIENRFSSGINAIYFEALFNEFSDDFLEHCMYNYEMLREYLKFVNGNKYHINNNYISMDRNLTIDPTEEIKIYLIESGTPRTYEQICADLSHIAPQKIKQTLNFNPDFINNGRNEYFHIDIAVLSDADLGDISGIITDAIENKKFISGNELYAAISSKYPYIIENNSTISELGLRKLIGYKLNDKFSFEGNIISSKYERLSMMDVFAEFCKSRDSFTLDELRMLKQELNTNIYFDAVYENSLRISQTNFVSKEQASFDKLSTDLAIDRFCTGEYIALPKINQFGSFPEAGFPWNCYLLEHYVAMYSSKYKLLHTVFNETACVGAVVKKSSSIDTYDELIIDALSNADVELTKEAALQFICDEGYQARRSYSGIEEVLIKAQELRNQKGN